MGRVLLEFVGMVLCLFFGDVSVGGHFEFPELFGHL